jgi:hypothetical protein
MDMSDELISKLILDGAVEFSGLSFDGQMLYSFTEKLEKLAPDLYAAIMSNYQADIYKLWELGFLQIDMQLENPPVAPTVLAHDERALGDLSEHLRLTLSQIVSETKRRLEL